MANSLIPYSFVPGTKAMASEVNANFLALADAVEEGKNYTTQMIDNFGVDFEARLDETFGSKLDANMSNSKNISNCIIEIPQNIQYDIDNSTGKLRLLAGSKVYVSTKGTFEAVTLTENTTYGAGELWTTTGTRTCFIVYIPDLDAVRSFALDYVYSQATAPSTFLANSAIWFDTGNNILKCTIDSGTTWYICSLPIIVGTPTMDSPSGWTNHIDNVFNGFGFFGQYTFVLPELKFLIPDGKNSDGTFNNSEIVTEKVKLNDMSGFSSILATFSSEGKLGGYGVNQYYIQATPPTNLWNANAYWYDTTNNKIYSTSDSGTTWLRKSVIIAGYLTKSGHSANITAMSIKPVFKAVEIQDVKDILNSCIYRAANGGFKMPNGLVINWGTISGDAGTVTYTYAFSSATSYGVVKSDYNPSLSGTTAVNLNWVAGMFIKGRTSTGFSFYNYNGTGGTHIWVAIGY